MEQEKQISEMDLQELRKLMESKAIIVQHDMNPEMCSECQDIIQSAIDGQAIPNNELAAKIIKETLDKKYGASWQCIIGEGFAYDVTVQSSTLLHMYYHGFMAILIFKS